MRRDAALVVLAFAPLCASAAVFRVPSEYPTVQAGLAAAAFGDSVVVAPGTYSNCDETPCTANVALLKEGVALIAEGGPEVTVLRVDTPAGGLSVVRGAGIGPGGALLKGFTITASATQHRGAAFIASSGILVEGCRFVDLATGFVDGGGVFANVASLTMRECVFRRCQATGEGGGLKIVDGPCVLLDCLFSECVNGGAVMVGHSGLTATVRDCVFENNTGNTALTILQMPTATIERNRFEGNASPQNAAAIVINGGGGGNGTVHLRENVFVGNHGTVNATAPISWNSSGSIEGNTFWGNSGVSASAVLHGSAVGTTTAVSRNIFAGGQNRPAYRAWFVTPEADCNLFWANAAGDYADYYVPAPTDLFADPLFCDPVTGDLTLRENSPCLPKNGSCGQIGALGQGCGVISVDPATWGSVKSQYRGGSR